MKSGESPGPVNLVSVAVISAALLAYEILLLRVFSFSQWHHFASLAVSLALLGFGVAGTVLALTGKRATDWGDRFFIGGLLIGGTGMVVSFVLTQLVSVRPLFAVWNMGELAKMLLLDFTAFLPFFGIGLSIGQVFMRWPAHTKSLYAANLFGSGTGALVAGLLLASVHLEYAILLAALLIFLTAALHALRRKETRALGRTALLGTILLGIWLAMGPPSLPLSDFKRLAYLLDLPDSEVLERSPGLRNEVTVVRSSSIRTAPGLSLRWAEAIPANDALVLGSDRIIPLTRTGNPGASDYFEATLGALPFKMRPRGKLAIVGASEWLPLPATQGRQSTWAQENPDIFRVFRDRGLLAGVDSRLADPREFLSSSKNSFSVLFLSDFFTTGDAVSEDYLMTVESLEMALSHLSEDGLLVVPVPVANPPRYTPRLLATGIRALARSKVEQPQEHMAFLRSMQAGLLIISSQPLGRDEITTIREFSEEWDFDLAVLPGLRRSEANRFHQLAEPVYFDSAQALFEKDRELPASADWYKTEAAVDAKPYFWHSMKWRNVPALLKEFGRRGLVWLDWSLLATVAKLVAAGLLALLLILFPLGRLPKGRPPLTRPRVCLYFASLGLGFLLLEMAAFQRAQLYLADPVITASLVFSVFLVGAGFGSLASPGHREATAPFGIFAPILGSALLAFVLLEFAEPVISGIALWMRLSCVAVAIAPLAYSLGKAFPWGLRQLDKDRKLIPWAWGINGFFSVLAAPLAALLSVHFGQTFSWLAAALFYALAWLIARNWSRQWSPPASRTIAAKT